MNSSRIADAILIPKNYIAFPSISFVVGALSKDETREVLHHMEVTKEGLITRYAATDGRRLHVAELDPGLFEDDIDILDPGLYLLIAKSTKFIVLQKTDEVMKFPDWKIILGDYEIGDNLAEVCDVSDSGKIGEVMIRTERLLDTGFLAQAMGYGLSRRPQEPVCVNFQARENNGPVILAHDHGTALVMPMMRKEPDPTLEDEAETYETAPIEGVKETPNDDLDPGNIDF